MTTKSALILAAGRGERLKPITDSIPKPLIKVGRYRLIEYHIKNLAKAGIKNVYINRAHLRESFNQLLDSDNYPSVNLTYLDEPQGALETAGAIINAFQHIDDDCLIVVNGDIWCDFNFIIFNKLYDFNKVDSHILLTQNPKHNPNGDFTINNSELLKPQTGKPTYTFTGIGIYKRNVFTNLPAIRQRLAPVLNQQIDLKKISATLYQGKWMDVGTLERLDLARKYLSSIEDLGADDQS